MPILTLSVAFTATERKWVITRARTVVAAYASRDQAIAAASEIAYALRRRMRCHMRIRVQGAHGEWHEYLALNDRRSAAVMALRVLYKLRLPAPSARARSAGRMSDARQGRHGGGVMMDFAPVAGTLAGK